MQNQVKIIPIARRKIIKDFACILLAGIAALALLFQNLQGFPGLASLRLNPVQKERERIVLRESVRVVVVNLQSFFRRFRFGEDNFRELQAMRGNQFVIASAPRGVQLEIRRDFSLALNPKAEALGVGVKRLFGIALGNFKPCVKVGLRVKVSGNVDSDNLLLRQIRADEVRHRGEVRAESFERVEIFPT